MANVSAEIHVSNAAACVMTVHTKITFTVWSVGIVPMKERAFVIIVVCAEYVQLKRVLTAKVVITALWLTTAVLIVTCAKIVRLSGVHIVQVAESAT